MKPYKVFILSGEASGDLHAGKLALALSELNPNIKMCGWGGDQMKKAGVDILKTYDKLAFMGFVEVIKNFPAILNNFKEAKRQIEAFKPDILILVDYPGFNLRMAKWAKKQNIRVVYYISPQIWAWKASRGYQIRDYVDQMICILPFEPAFYKQFGIDALYVGHPLTEHISDFKSINKNKETNTSEQIVALLPGSRTQEIKAILPVFLGVVKRNPELKFIIAKAPNQSHEFYTQVIGENGKSNLKNLEIETGGSYALLNRATIALVASGTATLETALFKVPQIVCYRGGRISYLIARMLIKVKYISLVNLILDRPFLTELIQDDCNEESINDSMLALFSPEREEYFNVGYQELEKKLSSTKSPSLHAAELILGAINE
jgi:lipid-A-disaccharide synthase